MRVKFLVPLLLTICMTACGGGESAETNQAVPHVEKLEQVVEQLPVVELTGKLVIKTYFGPPNFGEDPETDSKERAWILSLAQPANVQAETFDAGTFFSREYASSSFENVREIQLVLHESQRKLIAKTVVVNGTLFQAHTGHHHTDVLMDVRSIGLRSERSARSD